MNWRGAGFPSFAQRTLHDKMAKEPGAVLGFLRELAAGLCEKATAEAQELLELKKMDLLKDRRLRGVRRSLNR